MTHLRILYVTTENRDEARNIGSVLVQQKLCACVNILDGMESIYWWDGEVQSDTECVLLVKTTAEYVPAVTETILDLHSYDVPCVISLPLAADEGNEEYLQWIQNSVKHSTL
ncbi:divalent-cation tolerance protein CutA [Rhodohalobacter sp. 8-1]|uniref:divalent-cation tolerance protein CutA n=1 Tax=Rhodohalobacter sp. 8-1 TaxID=3131972 RepID=UPI0030EEF8C6